MFLDIANGWIGRRNTLRQHDAANTQTLRFSVRAMRLSILLELCTIPIKRTPSFYVVYDKSPCLIRKRAPHRTFAFRYETHANLNRPPPDPQHGSGLPCTVLIDHRARYHL